MSDDNEGIQEHNKRNSASELNGFHQYRSERCQIIPKGSFGFHASKDKTSKEELPFKATTQCQVRNQISDGNVHFKRLISKRHALGAQELSQMCQRGLKLEIPMAAGTNDHKLNGFKQQGLFFHSSGG